ncbi:MAG TPA: PEP-utilizing enzyme, partial [Tepidisphaeraceae bacterium]
RDRENLRFERTRLFGRVRRIFVEIGRRLMSEGLLENDRDIFYLTLDEVLAYVEGTSVDTDLKTIASRRLAAFARFRESLPPADRFETFGAVYLGNAFTAPASETPSTGGLKGTGCCPGVVRGRVRLIRDPRGAHLHHGEILVAERTDPGWIMLFPAATGVLVERGSLLSHSAIVARELGIPAIVSIPNLMTTLIDGQTVEMNGSTGTITVIEATE